MILDLHRSVYTDAAQYRSKMTMVLGELSVFLVLLVIAIWQLRKSFRKELALNRKQRNFLMSVTHELRSPLAATRLNIQTLLKRDLPKDVQADLFQRTLSETNRLEELVENILMSTSLEEDGFQPYIEHLNISEFCGDIIRELKTPLASTHQLEADIQSELFLHTDAVAFRSILTNLIANAVKYSPAKTHIQVSLKKTARGIELFVTDQGIGIPKEARDRIFDKFHREGNEEVRRTKGTGLGLFIVRELVSRTKGKITVSDNNPVGTIFSIIWNNIHE